MKGLRHFSPWLQSRRYGKRQLGRRTSGVAHLHVVSWMRIADQFKIPAVGAAETRIAFAGALRSQVDPAAAGILYGESAYGYPVAFPLGDQEETASVGFVRHHVIASVLDATNVHRRHAGPGVIAGHEAAELILAGGGFDLFEVQGMRIQLGEQSRAADQQGQDE